MDHHHPSSTNQTQTQTRSETQSEAERLLGIAEKLLNSRDLTGSREFALLAQETEPLLEGSDQILAIADVLLAFEKRVNNNRSLDLYSILQTDPRSDPDLIKSNHRRLALLLHPEKNPYPLADSAFKIVADAWAVLSDPPQRTAYDHEVRPQDKLPVRRSTRVESGAEYNVNNNCYSAPDSTTPSPPSPRATGQKDEGRMSDNFWTACPYCYVMYEYPNLYKECCIRCENCKRAFHAAVISSMPKMVEGKEAYYCCWGFFPLGFSPENGGKGKKDVSNHTDPNVGFPNWMPGMFTTPVAAAPAQQQQHRVNVNKMANAGVRGVIDFSNGSASGGYRNAVPGMSAPGAKKRGRPRKNPIGF